MTVTGNAIDVRGLTKSFDGHRAVDGIDLVLRSGRILGFLGANGSGKTTTIRMLCGLLVPDAGSGTCLGFDIMKAPLSIKRETGYMPQRFGLYDDLTIRENLEFVARLYLLPEPRRRVDEALARLGLEARADQLTGTLSGGWKQRLALAACMLHTPRLLLLDEPTAGVDPNARRQFWDEIHELAAQGITVLVSTHYMDEAERCHELAYVAAGRLLLRGTPHEIVATSGLSTWSIRSEVERPDLMRRLEHLPGAEMVAAFGTELRVSGTDASLLERALAPFAADPALRANRVETGLEDVFVHMLRRSGPEAD